MHYYEYRRINNSVSRIWEWKRTGSYEWTGRPVGYSYDTSRINTNLTKI